MEAKEKKKKDLQQHYDKMKRYEESKNKKCEDEEMKESKYAEKERG